MPLERALSALQNGYLIIMIELSLLEFQAFKMERQVGKNEHFRHHIF